MEHTNLAAAILLWADSRISPSAPEGHNEFSHESAIDLANWLQRESSMNTWRNIYLAPAYEDQPTAPADESPSLCRFKRP